MSRARRLVGGLSAAAVVALVLALPVRLQAQPLPMTPEDERSIEEEQRRQELETPMRILDLDDHRDPRSVELMRWDCRDEVGRHDVTLFANGTIRSRRGPSRNLEMQLEELGPLELGRYVIRLREIRANRDFPSQLEVRGGVSGDWVGTCVVSLDLPGSAAITLKVGALDILPLPLQQIRQIADQLESFTRPLRAPSQLPRDYVPEVGDVLVDARGQGFRVVRWTLDEKGVELDSLDGMQRIYILASELPNAFVRLERRTR